MLGQADRAFLVTRNCYLALRRAAHHSARPTGVILVREPTRPLLISDVEQVLDAPVVATVDMDHRVALATDAGLLSTRVPGSLRRPLAALVPNRGTR
jgi:hypothetical protein